MGPVGPGLAGPGPAGPGPAVGFQAVLPSHGSQWALNGEPVNWVKLAIKGNKR